MNKEDKELLLKDLCARLPYNVVINCTEDDDERTNFNCFFTGDMVKDIQNEVAMWNIKPYLRPMSSMTEEEDKEWQYYKSKIAESCDELLEERIADCHNFFNYHHLDYHGLIEKGLAIEVTEENNPYK